MSFLNSTIPSSLLVAFSIKLFSSISISPVSSFIISLLLYSPNSPPSNFFPVPSSFFSIFIFIFCLSFSYSSFSIFSSSFPSSFSSIFICLYVTGVSWALFFHSSFLSSFSFSISISFVPYSILIFISSCFCLSYSVFSYF